MRYVLYGVKGSGLSSLSLILNDLGKDVIGIDKIDYIYTQDELIKRNIKIYDFNEYKFNSNDILIFGHSFKDSLEVLEAKKICKEFYEYHEFVNKLAKQSKLSIAIAGSHGKTYTTGLISYLLNEISTASYLIGDGEGKYINNDIFVFEACEYQDHFLIYDVDIAIVLNIDYDHVDYFKTEENYIESFRKFIEKSKFVILNKNDKNLSKIKVENVMYYDINEISDLKLLKEGYSFNYLDNKFNTNIYGVKHLENLLACIKLFQYLNIEIKDYKDYINKFKGVKRRFEETIINGDIYIDDYAHHPTQIKYTIETIKNKYKEYELIVFFKPDRPSRFLTFYKQIATSLKQADYVVFMENSSCDVNLDIIINLDNKFYKYDENILNKIKKINKKIVVTFSSKNMKEVYEKIFINTDY